MIYVVNRLRRVLTGQNITNLRGVLEPRLEVEKPLKHPHVCLSRVRNSVQYPETWICLICASPQPASPIPTPTRLVQLAGRPFRSSKKNVAMIVHYFRPKAGWKGPHSVQATCPRDPDVPVLYTITFTH